MNQQVASIGVRSLTSTPIEQPTRTGAPVFGVEVTPVRVGLGLVVLALFVLPFADLATLGRSPWPIAVEILSGFSRPDFSAVENLGYATLLTLAFALGGLAFGVVGGTLLAFMSAFTLIRVISAVLRSIHELIWAILLMAVLGPTVATGILAIGLAYAGIFAKVYSEILVEADQRPNDVLPPRTDLASRFIYGRIAVAFPALITYTSYRLECAIRSSAVLGFIGLPTLGFQLDSFFKQGAYGAVSAVLIIYFGLIATMPFWLRRQLVPVYLVLAWAVLAFHPGPPIAGSSVWNFISHDIVPAPLRDGAWTSAQTWTRTWGWFSTLFSTQVVPGLVATLIVAQITLALSGIVALLVFPVSVSSFTGKLGSTLGHAGLVVGRSTPEYMLAYLFLQMFGPSMLPAILALSLHNGAIIAHLTGRQATEVTKTLRPDAPRGLNLYLYEILPRIFGPFLALSLYRWEIILRETAILGILGVKTLGFHIDSAISELRIDRAVMLIIFTALLTILIDALSRALRQRLKLTSSPTTRCDG
jgi:phosphonate transport system permease protein